MQLLELRDDFAVEFRDDDGDDTYTGKLPIALQIDDDGEATGNIKLTLNVDPDPAKTYRLGTSTEGVITILDDDAPELEIRPVVDAVTEAIGAEARFRVSARVSPNEPVTIQYNVMEVVTNPGDLGLIASGEEGNKSKELDFSSNETSVEFAIPLMSDTTSENDSTLRVQLRDDSVQTPSGMTYTRSGTVFEANVQLVDDDSLPVISIVADSGDIAENAGPAMFKLTATGLTATTTLSINATPAEDGADFLTDAIAGTADDFAVEFRDDDGDDTYTGKLPIALQIDDDGEATGNIKLTLNVDPDPAKTYRLGTSTEGVITILDDDAPELEIRPVVDAVTEAIGAEARFRVSARLSPNEPVTIQYNVMEVVTNPGDQGLIASGEEGNKSKELDFRNDVTSIEFAIPLMSDTTSEDDSTLRVQLRDDTDQTASGLTYTRSGTVFEANVQLVDDDSLPVISILADSGDIAENAGPAMFKLTATGLTVTTTLSINATPAEDGADFLTDEIAGTADDFNVEFRDDDGDDTYTGKLPIALQIDDDGEATGNIKLTLNVAPDPAKTYRLGTSTEGVITILDDDAPELEIRPVVDAVTEAIGAEARFRVSARVSPNEPVTIQYNVMEVVTNPGDLGLIASSEEGNKSKELDFRNDVTSIEFAIPLMSDTTSEDDSTLRVQLRDDTDQTASGLTYTRSGTVFEANVQLVDDDSLPVISILADSGDIAENAGPAMFKLTATGLTVTTTLSINATPAEDGADFLTDEIAGTADDFNVEFRDDDGDDTYTGKLPIALQIDDDGEATGNIKLTLNVDPDPAKTYRLGTTTEGVITILDDDAPELSIAGAGEVSETTGAMATFTVSARVSPNDSINVYYTVTESSAGDGDFIATGDEGDQDTMLNFSSNATSASLTVPITPDDISEASSTVSVVLRVDDDGTLNYTIPVTPTPGTVIVNNDDSFPKIKIATDYEFISPGLPLTFAVSIEPKNQTPVTVPITAHDETNSSLDFRTSPLIVGTDGTVTGKVGVLPSSTGNVTITLGNVAGFISDPPLVVPIETPSNPASLTISGPSGPVTEGDMATFTISADPTINKNIIIEVDVFDHVAKGTDFVDSRKSLC